MKFKMKRLFFPLLTISVISTFPALFLYFQNADEAGFTEIIPALLCCWGGGILLFAVSCMITHSMAQAAITSSFLMMLLLNFSFIENVLKTLSPSLRYWHTAPIILVIGMHLVYLIRHFIKENLAEDIIKIFSVTFGGLIIVNMVFAMPHIINHIQARQAIKEARNRQDDQQAMVSSDNPNVYLIIFDEYANFMQMNECYDYDNAPLQNFLTNNSFNISYTSHNESIFSETVQTNMVNLDYIVDDKINTSDRALLRHNGILFDIMRKQGYEIQIFENMDFYGGSMPQTTSSTLSAATTMSGENLQTLLLQRTAFYPFLTQTNTETIKEYNVLSEYLSTQSKMSNNTFTLAYFRLPHPPFFVDENGNDIPRTVDWSDRKYYLGQFKYATKLMISICGGIIKNDPDCVIILMSDHGARGIASATWDMKTNSLNTVYYQGKALDIEGLSNVNTIRLVLNKLFDMDYDMVSVPVQEAEE